MRQISETVCYNWFETIWNEKNRDLIREKMTDDVIIHGLGEDTVGIPPFEAFYDSFNAAFNDIYVDVTDVVSQDDMEAGLCEVRATHNESGKPVSFSGMYLIRTRHGKIAESWNVFDFLTMNQQMGYELKLKEEA
jgi:predicted ester cyclase